MRAVLRLLIGLLLATPAPVAMSDESEETSDDALIAVSAWVDRPGSGDSAPDLPPPPGLVQPDAAQQIQPMVGWRCASRRVSPRRARRTAQPRRHRVQHRSSGGDDPHSAAVFRRP